MDKEPNVAVKVLFFAKAAELMKERNVIINFSAKCVVSGNKLKEALFVSCPQIKPIEENVILALNQNYVEDDDSVQLKAGDEIAVIPPISGGSVRMDLIEITPGPLNVDKIISHVTLPNCGAISIFMGTTRDKFENKAVLRLEYEAYEPMAIKKMKEVAEDMRARWTVKKTAIVHRTGIVPVGESSIIISACSEHRHDAQEAVKWALDRIKGYAPIWKKEVYEDGSCWKENKECFWILNKK